MARGAVLPWPGLATAEAYTVMTRRKVMNTCRHSSVANSQSELRAATAATCDRTATLWHLVWANTHCSK
jgi:hypothetical protein